MADAGRTLAVLGAGKAAEALIAGVISSGWREPGEIVATARHQERLDDLAARHGIRTTLANAEAVQGAGIVVIGVGHAVLARERERLALPRSITLILVVRIII